MIIMSKKRTKEQNKNKATRYRLRKRVKRLEEDIIELEKKLIAIKESGSPEDIERVEKNVVFAKKNAELFSQYKVENILTKEQYNQKKVELRESLFTNDIKQSKSIAAKKSYYKRRYGSDWQQVMAEKKTMSLNIPFKANTNEYRRERYRLKKEEARQLEIKMFNGLGYARRERVSAIAVAIAKKRKKYNNIALQDIPDKLTRYYKYADSHGYVDPYGNVDFFSVPSEIMSEARHWDRLDICEAFALRIITVYYGVIKALKLTTIPPYNIFDFIPPFMEITDTESMLLKWREKEFLELKVFIDKHLQKEVDKNITVEEPAEK